MEAKSSAPWTVRISNRRYSLFWGLPSMKTTMLATEFVPCVLEMS